MMVLAVVLVVCCDAVCLVIGADRLEASTSLVVFGSIPRGCHHCLL